MMMSRGGRVVGAPDAAQMQLETLELMPCGCIVAVQTVRPSGVPVISFEAKGPHCTHSTHRANKVIRLGEPYDPLDYEERGDLFI
jgi:hypothetical protein